MEAAREGGAPRRRRLGRTPVSSAATSCSSSTMATPGAAVAEAACLRDADPGFLCSYIAFELDHGNARSARRRRGGLPARRGLGFWRSYIAFELDHGDARSMRAVAEVARPHDAAVHAKYAKAELRLGDDDRAPAMRARAQEWLVDEVRRYGDSISERGHEQLEDKSL